MAVESEWDDSVLASTARIARGVHRDHLVMGSSGEACLRTAAFRYDPPNTNPSNYGCSVECVELISPDQRIHPSDRFTWETHCIAVITVGLVRAEPQTAGVVPDPVENHPAHCLIRVRDRENHRRWWEPLRARLIEEIRNTGTIITSEDEAGLLIHETTTINDPLTRELVDYWPELPGGLRRLVTRKWAQIARRLPLNDETTHPPINDFTIPLAAIAKRAGFDNDMQGREFITAVIQAAHVPEEHHNTIREAFLLQLLWN